MQHLGDELSFFEELETAAKRLSIGTERASARDLERLFESLKEMARREDAFAGSLSPRLETGQERTHP